MTTTLIETLDIDHNHCSYRSKKLATDNEALLTDQYIKLQMTRGLLTNTKIYFSGQDSALGSLFSNVLKLGGEEGAK